MPGPLPPGLEYLPTLDGSQIGLPPDLAAQVRARIAAAQSGAFPRTVPQLPPPVAPDIRGLPAPFSRPASPMPNTQPSPAQATAQPPQALDEPAQRQPAGAPSDAPPKPRLGVKSGPAAMVEGLTNVADGYDNAAAVAADRGELAAQNAEQEYQIRQEAAAQHAQLQQQHAEARAAEQARLKQLTGDVDQAVKEFNGREIDRGRLWRNASNGKKALFVIGSIMAGAGSAMKKQGDKNPALAILMQAINDDVAEQMANIEKAGQNVSMKRGQLSQYRELMGDVEAARQATAAGLMAEVEEQIKSAAAATGSQSARLAAADAIAGLQVERGKAVSDAGKALHGVELSERQLQEQVTARKADDARGWAALKQQEKFKAMDYDLQLKAMAAKRIDDVAAHGLKEDEKIVDTVYMSDGSLFTARTKEEAVKLRSKVAATRSVVGFLDEMDQLVAEYGGNTGLIPSVEVQRLRTLSNSVLLSLKDSEEMGTIDKGVLTLMEGLTGGAGFEGLGSFLGSAGVGSDMRPGLTKLREAQLSKATEIMKTHRSGVAPLLVERPTVAPRTQTAQTAYDLGKEAPGIFDVSEAYLADRVSSPDGLTTDQRVGMSSLAQLAKAGDASAIAALRKLATGAGTRSVREAAKKLLPAPTAARSPVGVPADVAAQRLRESAAP